jgi:WhiB family transcriptional regulator, redox-sensing transcriptional regulator
MALPRPADLPSLSLRELRRLIYSAPRACGEAPELCFGTDDEPADAHAERVASARALCAGCPVRLACMARAIRNNERYGVWAGLDAEAGEVANLDAAAHLMRTAARPEPPQVAA